MMSTTAAQEWDSTPQEQGIASSGSKQLFVGNLPWQVSWQDLKDLFKGVGHVVRADVATTSFGKSRGFGTVLFDTVEEAQAAIEQFNNYDWNGRMIEVREDRRPGPSGNSFAPKRDYNTYRDNSSPIISTKLFVGNLPFSANSEDLKDLFAEYGSVVDATIEMDFRGERSRGFGFVTFETTAEAEAAVSELNGADWNGRPIRVRFEGRPESNTREKADFNAAPRTVSGTRGRQLYVGNLPYSLHWQDLKDIFRKVGNVVRADVSQDGNGRSRGFGLVVMSSVEEADAAIAELNGFEVNGRTIDVRFDKFQNDGPAPAQQSAPSAPAEGEGQLFVGNLPFSYKWQDLKDIFRPDFTPIHADVWTDPFSGQSKGCGTVRFSTKEEAHDAIEKFNGQDVGGRNLFIKLDNKYHPEE